MPEKGAACGWAGECRQGAWKRAHDGSMKGQDNVHNTKCGQEVQAEGIGKRCRQGSVGKGCGRECMMVASKGGEEGRG